MNLIAAVSRDWGIGKDGGLLFSIPEDLRFFKEATWGGLVILGRRTLAALPGGGPLPGRKNLILSGNKALAVSGAQVCHSAAQALQTAREFQGESWVIGGGQVYRALLPYCRRALLTKIEAAPLADTFFPNLDEASGWRLTQVGSLREWNGLRFSFCTYENEEAQPW